MEMDLDLVAEAADGPLVAEELPDGNSLTLITCVVSTLVSYACATECLGTASTITCGPCVSSAASFTG
jgi:hypothetical protein